MSTSNVIIDLSHNNANANLQQAQAAGIVGVIHKATQGVAFVDPTYAARRQAAANAGLLWGAYHFGTAADPVAQAKFFLRGASPAAKDLIVLDFEANPGNPANTMSLDQARDFIAALRDAQQTTPAFMGVRFSVNNLGMPWPRHCRHAGYSGPSTVRHRWSHQRGQPGLSGSTRMDITAMLPFKWMESVRAIAISTRAPSMISEPGG